jgi:uncharacterized protein involved in exopolysaccharide biosynthesis
VSQESQELASLRDQLETLQMRYTENHPDVRRVQAMIDKLEAKEEKAQEEAAEAAAREPDPLLEPGEPDMAGPDMNAFMPSAGDMLKPQLEQVNYEIQNIRADIAKTKQQIDLYQRRVEETPRIEQEVLELKRDYANLKELYDSLLSRKLEAEISVSMEKKQKGEQFRILDPAKRPEIPIEPDIRRIFLLTIALGLGLGGGLAYGIEILNTSFRNPEEASESLGLPVLITLPLCLTAGEERARRRTAWLKAAGVAAGFLVTAGGIVLAIKGVQGTLQYVKGYLPLG